MFYKIVQKILLSGSYPLRYMIDDVVFETYDVCEYLYEDRITKLHRFDYYRFTQSRDFEFLYN